MRAIPLALVAVSLVLAGCTAEPPAPEPEAPTVILVTDVNDVESLSNDSFMMAAHQHDYWGGKERLTVLDATIEPGECCVTMGGGGLDLMFAPADGSVVPHGTARVEVTVTFAEGMLAHYGAPELLVRTAADHEPLPVAAIEDGAPTVIETSEAQLDLPHQSLSAWRFLVHLRPGPSTMLTQWDGQLHIVAEAVRGREIPIYPPHPDLWNGAEAIELFMDEQAPMLWAGTIDENERGYSCIFGCWPQIHRPVNGTVVPYDAAMIEVVLDARPSPGTDFGLKHHGADTRNFTDLQPTSVEGTVRTYHVPVTPATGDSPYAVQSVWGFAIFGASPERDGWVSGSYLISARVLRVAP